MSTKNFLRIGVFYDGTFFVKAQNYFWGLKHAWLSFQEFHKLLESFIRTKEQGYDSYRVVYSAWFQGVHKESAAQENNLRLDRKRQLDLLHAGIEPKNVPMSETQGEKGIDVYMAVETLQVGLDDKIDMAVLVTGDGDFVPLVRALMKNGVRVLIAYFEYEDGANKSFANERLISAANFSININSLETDRDFKAEFKTIFRQPADNKKAADKALK
ncbi:MAG TPA: NYN domain-containing protein [Mucilaginibacter sp.]|nr:NYN domain-containing protein [Mucilaginibacter sp.]